MLGQMDQEVIPSRAQLPQQAPLVSDLGGHSLLFPAAIDRVRLRDGGVAGQHGLRAAIDQRVDFRPGNGARQRREHGGGQQHVAMVAQLGHEHAMNFGEGYGVREPGSTW